MFLENVSNSIDTLHIEVYNFTECDGDLSCFVFNGRFKLIEQQFFYYFYFIT